jgi:hypothetical protein
MEPLSALGATASIIACIQLTEKLLERVGPSDYKKEDLNRILRTIEGFRDSYNDLKSYFEANAEDEVRLSALQHLDEPLRVCKEALDILQKRLSHVNFIGKYIVGLAWDSKMKKGLQRLDEAKDLFKLVLHKDEMYDQE